MDIKKNIYRYLVLFSTFFLLDRVTKSWALSVLLKQSQIVVSPFFNLSFVWNRGVSWGLFSHDSALVFGILTGTILLVILIFLIYTFIQYKNCISVFFETLVLAGAISNVVDRFCYGAVVDFIELHINNWYWPTFNIADVCVVVGIIGILIQNMGSTSHVAKNKKSLF